MWSRIYILTVFLIYGGLAPITALDAAELNIGMATEATSLDPHYHNVTPNNSVRRHVFESIVNQNAHQRLQPQLAESWRLIDETTWEFKLRQGVTFHNGSPLTATDIVYSICRVSEIKNSPSSFTIYTRGVQNAYAADAHTVIIETGVAYPLLAVELSSFGIVSAAAAGVNQVTFGRDGCEADRWPSREVFDSGELAVGTGPFRLKEWSRGERIVLDRNEDYWGPKPEWSRVVLETVPEDARRSAGLLSGALDMIEKPGLRSLRLLRAVGTVNLVSTPSNRVIYLSMEQANEPAPGITGTGGRNPLKDIRVRAALSMAIDRTALADRVLGGMAIPAHQLLPPGFFGYNAEIELPYDREEAKRLLAEAGYPDGFGVVLATPNDRYLFDERVAQAVAQMWSLIGVDATVDAMTARTFFSRARKREFGIFLAGWAAFTGEASSPLKSLVATRDPDRGLGPTNRSGYSNPRMDAFLMEAIGTIDDDRRERLLQQAMGVVMTDYAILPLHFEKTLWGLREGLTYQGRADQYTVAQDVSSIAP